MSLRDWIRKGRELGASDLHLEADTPLVARVRGDLLTVAAPIPGAALVQAGREVLGTEAWTEFASRGSADVSRTIHGVRCRINLFQTVRGVGAPSSDSGKSPHIHPASSRHWWMRCARTLMSSSWARCAPQKSCASH